MTGMAARIFGIIYLVVGILGFIPGFSAPMTGDSMGGMSMLLGVFPVNPLHNIVHVVIGLGGIFVAGNLANAQNYFKTVAVVYALLTLLGALPQTNTVFGLVPLYSWDIGLHLVTALIAAYFGWIAQDRATTALA